MTEDSTQRKRASRHTRLHNPPPITLTSRDKEVVKFVNDFRVVRQEHIERLLFHSNSEKSSKTIAQRRLWLLWQHGFLKREFLPVMGGVQNSPILYLLDKQGADLLLTEFKYERSQLRWFTDTLSPQFLRHTLGLSDIRAAITRASQRHSLPIAVWDDETTMKADFDHVQVGGRKQSLIPDGYFALQVPGGYSRFFIEFDRGPEGHRVLHYKVKAYEGYFESGLSLKRYQTDKIRVLIIVEGTRKRLDNLKDLAERSTR